VVPLFSDCTSQIPFYSFAATGNKVLRAFTGVGVPFQESLNPSYDNWPIPLSLATTYGSSIDFFSSRY
jgi:hypothetical protein